MGKTHDYLLEKFPVSFYNSILKDDYGDDIDMWYKGFEKYRDNIKLKSLKNLDYKKIKERLCHKFDDKGRIYISPRNRIYDLSIYYDNPSEYYFDLINIIRYLSSSIDDPNTATTFIYPTKETTRISSIHFMFNMIMWYPLFNLGITITPSKLFMPKQFNNNTYTEYIDNEIIEPYKHIVTFNQMSKMLSRVYDLFILVSEKIGLYLGMSFSTYDVYMRWKNNKELYDINHTYIPEDMSIADAEVMMDQRSKRFEEIMRTEETDSQLRPFLESGRISSKQGREFFVNIGFKPDLEGRTLNTRPQTNFITAGLRDPVDYITDASGGRKAANLALQIDEGGYFQRTLCKSAADLTLYDDLEYDCGSKHYYEMTIKSKKDLEYMRGRYFAEKGHIKQLTENDFEYIGKTLRFRTPATCACKKGICKVCYGSLASQNLNINIGINSALINSEHLYQNMMSAKHILSTTSTSFEVSNQDTFYDFFSLESGYRIVLKDDIDFAENFDLMININEIRKGKNTDVLSNSDYVNGFSIYNHEEEKEIRIDEVKGNPLYLSNDTLEIIIDKRDHGKIDENGWIRIPFTAFTDKNDEIDVFFVQYTNKEISKPLHELKKLIEKSKDIESCTDISSLINNVKRLLQEGGIYTPILHTEIICRNLIRDKNDLTKIPDYSKEDIEYTFISIHNSILNGNSLIQSLTFERLGQQLREPATYRKNGTSPYDVLFITGK